MLLYHGRFQPPHSGHTELIRHFLSILDNQDLVVSMDIRKKDKNNPYDFHSRKISMLGQLPELSDRVVITSHKPEKPYTFKNCMQAIWNQTFKKFPIEKVITGPKNARVAGFYNYRGIKVLKARNRFFDVSGTKIREKAGG